jgi:hypothetical protein
VGDTVSMGSCTVTFGAKRLDYDEFSALIGRIEKTVIYAEYNTWNLNNGVSLVRVSVCYIGQCCFIEFNNFKCQLIVLLVFLTSKLFAYFKALHH